MSPASKRLDSWVLHDPNAEDLGFSTESEVLEAAAHAIEEYLDNGQWSYEVKDLHITHGGRVTHVVVEIPCDPPDDVQDAMEDDPEYRPPCDFYCDYEMRLVDTLLRIAQ